jgi:hypothetical protein
MGSAALRSCLHERITQGQAATIEPMNAESEMIFHLFVRSDWTFFSLCDAA